MYVHDAMLLVYKIYVLVSICVHVVDLYKYSRLFFYVE
jgi:hypothetical protein